jgi:hypothetical protein
MNRCKTFLPPLNVLLDRDGLHRLCRILREYGSLRARKDGKGLAWEPSRNLDSI